MLFLKSNTGEISGLLFFSCWPENRAKIGGVFEQPKVVDFSRNFYKQLTQATDYPLLQTLYLNK